MSTAGLAGIGKLSRDPRIEFWSKPSDWPEDTKDYVFAARGLQEYGRKVLGEAWSDEAAKGELVFDLPEKLTIYTDRAHIERADALLRKAGLRSEPVNWLVFEGPDFPSQEEWKIAHRLSVEEGESSWSAFWPFVIITKALANYARNGNLVTATSAIAGGEIKEEPWHFWNFSNRQFRFDSCRATADGSSFNGIERSELGRWIFFKRDSLSTLTETRPNYPPPKPDSTIKSQVYAERRGRGRPSEYNWPELATVFRQRFDAGAWDSLTDQQIASELAAWAHEKWDKEPTDSVLRARVREWSIACGRAGKTLE